MKPLSVLLLSAGMLAAPAGLTTPTAALAQAGCVGDVPAGWLRPGGYCDLITQPESLIEQPPGTGGRAPGGGCDEGSIMELGWVPAASDGQLRPRLVLCHEDFECGTIGWDGPQEPSAHFYRVDDCSPEPDPVLPSPA